MVGGSSVNSNEVSSRHGWKRHRHKKSQMTVEASSWPQTLISAGQAASRPSMHVTHIEQVRSKGTKENFEARENQNTVLSNPIVTRVKCHTLVS